MGWTQPIWKTCASKWETSPSRGENKQYLKPPHKKWADRLPQWKTQQFEVKIPINFCFQICNWEASPGLYPQNSAPKTEGLRMSSFIISWIVIKTNMAKVLPCRRAKTLIPDPRWSPATACHHKYTSTTCYHYRSNNKNYHDYHYLALNTWSVPLFPTWSEQLLGELEVLTIEVIPTQHVGRHSKRRSMTKRFIINPHPQIQFPQHSNKFPNICFVVLSTSCPSVGE